MARDDSRTQDVSVTTDTFLTLITQTNELLNSLRTEVITANGAVAETGATSTDERHAILFGRFAANTLVATNDIRGGNNTTSDLLTVSSNVNCNGQLSQIFSDLNITNNNGNGQGLNYTFVIDVTDVTSNGETTTVTSNTLFRYTDLSTALDIKNNAGATTIDVITDDYVANTETTIISGNTSLYFNDDTELAVSVLKNASSNVNITADDFYVTTVDTIQANTDETTVRSNTHFKYVTSDSSAIHITENGSSLETIDITADLLNINTANVDIDGTGLHTIAGNVSFDTGVLFVDAINNEVGINSTNPDATLDLNGTANVAGNTYIGAQLLVSSSIASPNPLVRLTQLGTGDVIQIYDETTDTTPFVVDAGGNTGIGNSSPDAKLAVTGTANVSGNVWIGGNQDTDGDLNVDGTVTWTDTGTTHTIAGNVSFDAGVLYVDSINNEVGINSTNPDATLDLNGTANVSSDIWIGGNAAIDGIITHKTDVVYDVQSTSITGSNITVYTLDCAVFGSGKFSAQVVEGVNRQCTEFVVAANTTVATLTVYATVSTSGSDLGDFSVVISGDDALIRYNRVGSNSQDVTISATTFKI